MTNRTCEECGASFSVFPSVAKRKGKARFCSRQCVHAAGADRAKSRPLADRLREQIKVSADCWNWVGNTQKGYGVLSVSGRPVRAHRLVLGLALGRVVHGWVLHKCDNRLCCRPDHLYEGSRHDNVRDAVERDRFAKGESHGQAVLTADLVRAIREAVASGQTGKSQAARFGVHVMTVSDIVRRKTWTHI